MVNALLRSGRPVGGRTMRVAPSRIATIARLSFRVQAQNQPEVLSVVNTISDRMRETPGCCGSRLLSDVDDPNAFTQVSEWLDAASAEQFLASRDFQILRGIRILLRSEPVVIVDQVHSRAIRVLDTEARAHQTM